MTEQLALARERNLTVKVSYNNARRRCPCASLPGQLTSLPESHPHWRFRSIPIAFEISGEYTYTDLQVSRPTNTAALSQSTVSELMLWFDGFAYHIP